MNELSIALPHRDHPYLADGWRIIRKDNAYYVCWPSRNDGHWNISDRLVFVDFIAGEAISTNGARFELLASSAMRSVASREGLVGSPESAPLTEDDERELFSRPQKIFPSLIYPMGATQFRPILAAIASKTHSAEAWAPGLKELLTQLDLDPAHYHRAIWLDRDSWRQALLGMRTSVSLRCALHAWLISQIFGLAYLFNRSEEWVTHWLHHSEPNIRDYRSPKKVILSGDTSALIALFRKLFLIQAQRCFTLE